MNSRHVPEDNVWRPYRRREHRVPVTPPGALDEHPLMPLMRSIAHDLHRIGDELATIRERMR